MKKHYNVGSNNSAWKGGKPKCLDCGKQLSDYISKRCKSCAHKGKLNVNYKKKIPLEQHPSWRGGISFMKGECIDCKRIIDRRSKRCSYCSNKKELNANWKGGKSYEPYSSLFDRQLKDRIRVRDNFICQLCGIPELELKKRLSVHHIDYDKNNCNQENLKSLCHNCNSKVNFKRDYWENYFKYRLVDIAN